MRALRYVASWVPVLAFVFVMFVFPAWGMVAQIVLPGGSLITAAFLLVPIWVGVWMLRTEIGGPR